MLYMANPSKGPVLDAMNAGLLGMISTPAQGNRIPDGALWCADNGCFGKGYPGDVAWLAWLDRKATDAERCLFATAPDVVGDAAATLARSRPLLAEIRARGYKAAYVAQNGIEHTEIPWAEFDVLFLGGVPECRPCGRVAPVTSGESAARSCPGCGRFLTEWKLGPVSVRVIREAKARGKWVHMGRVNSRRRWDFAEYHGVDSVDGTFLTYGPETNLARLTTWLQPKPPGLFDNLDDIQEESA